MRAWLVAILLAWAGSLSPATEAACGSKVFVEPRLPLAPPPAVGGAAAGVCASTPWTGEVSARVLPRGSTEVSVHYHADLGAGVPTLVATLDGQGFVGHAVTLSRVCEDLCQGYRYASAGFEALPDGPASSGTLTATVVLPGGAQDAATWTVTP